MIFKEQLNDFAKRGESLKNGFAQRYGGGNPGFAGTSQIAESFRDDAGDMVKKVVETDTKSINDMISSALADKVKEEVKVDEPSTYTKPNETVATANMSPGELEDFISNMTKNEENAKKASAENLTDDSGIKNVAAALQTTQDGTLFGLDGFGLDPNVLASILEAQKNATATEAAPDNPAPLTPPGVSDKFSDLVDTAFGKTQDNPESYKLSSLKATYTKVTDENKQNVPLGDLSNEDIDSIDVIGELADLANEDIGSIDVIGNPEDDLSQEDLSSIDVIGEENLAPEEDSYDFGDNPWERFKQLYLDFYTGGRGAEALKDFNKRTLAGEFDGLAENLSPNRSAMEYDNISPMSRNTDDILRMNREKDQMDTISTMMEDNTADKKMAPTVINNNRTIVARSPEDSKTKRVFTDDNTFNRLSMADSNHPQYMSNYS